MNIIFIHQNFPAQFKNIAPVLAADPQNKVVAITATDSDGDDLKNITYYQYKMDGKHIGNHPLTTEINRKILRGESIIRVAEHLKKEGFIPDVVYVHVGWGEGLFIKDIWPDAYFIGYFEYFYQDKGQDVNFDPEFTLSDEQRYRLRLKNIINYQALESVDYAISPTKWQRSTYPKWARKQIDVIHEGVDTKLCCPDENQQLELGKKGLRLTKQDQIITFVTRSLEPLRGFHQFMRALPQIMSDNPKAHIIILGRDAAGYGAVIDQQRSFKNIMLDEMAGQLDSQRVHFLGFVAYETYLSILQISTVHVYLTYPFILSWSLLEAMSCACTIVASSTAPVKELIKHNKNGLLVDFFNQHELTAAVNRLLNNKQTARKLGSRARKFILENFTMNASIRQHQAIINHYKKQEKL